jgi:hypothetical protein
MMSNLLDGLNGIVNENSIKQVIRSILFFDKEIVEQQSLDIKRDIEQGVPVPVRYTSNRHFYKQNEVKRTEPPFLSKKMALEYVKNPQNKPVFHRETNLKVRFDNDGNYATKKDIEKYTKHILTGKERTIVNYNIAHIWGKTDNPLFFSLMWNYCLVPAPYAFLTDKKDCISLHIQNLIQAISIQLYNPDHFLKNWEKRIETPSPAIMEEAKELITSNAIKFVPINN